jgi:hypothetical protein
MHFSLPHAAIVTADFDFGHCYVVEGLSNFFRSQWLWEIEKAMENLEKSSSFSGVC